MVKTIRLINDAHHKNLVRIQGKMQAEKGEYQSMDDVIGELIHSYKAHNRSLRSW